jgi:hypothetical protein
MTDPLTIPPLRPLPAERRERLRQQLITEYRRSLGSPGRRAPRRVLVVAVAASITALLAAAAYAGYLLTRPSDQLSVGCYQRASLQANTAVFETDGRAPATVCAREWSRAFPHNARPASFATCLLHTGVYGVFPGGGDSTCAKLGLATASPAKQARVEALKFAQLKQALVAALLGRCLDKRSAQTNLRRLLDAHGYRDWRVTARRPFSAARPCASLAFDTAHRTLILVPMPRS